jgi:hypothetical protein
MANRSKQKGDRFEYQVRDRFNMIPGCEAKRVGLPAQSSSRPGQNTADRPGDVTAKIGEVRLKVECKSRKGNEGWKQITKWLEGVDVLALKDEGSMNPLIVMNWSLFEDFVRDYLASRGLLHDDGNTGEPEEAAVGVLDPGDEAE